MLNVLILMEVLHVTVKWDLLEMEGFVLVCPNLLYLVSDGCCLDVNECDLGEDDCDENARCLNTFGSFTCECNFGYMGSGSTGNCCK